jgi:hypothetical protein
MQIHRRPRGGASRRCPALFLVVLAFLISARAASAQPVADEVYADAKDIITELIERDVAEAIAPNLACYSPGGLLKYYPGSLQALYERNFGALKAVLEHETIALAGNYTFESFRQRRSIPLSEFLPMAHFSPGAGDAKIYTDKDNQKVGCVDHIKELGGPATYQQELAQAARRMSNGVYLPLDTCTGPKQLPPALELPCLFAQAAVATANGHAVDAQELLITAVGATTATVLADSASITPEPNALANLQRMVIDEVRARFATGAFSNDGLFSMLGATDFGQVIALAQKPLNDIFASPNASLRQRAGALRLLLAPSEAPKAQVSPVKGENTSLALLPFLTELVPVVQPNESAGAGIARAILVQLGQVVAGNVQATIADDGDVLLAFDPTSKLAVSLTGPGLARLAALADMQRTAAQYEHWLAQLDPSGGKDPLDLAMIQGALGLVQTIESLAAAVGGIDKNSAGKFDVVTLLDGVARGKFTQALCPQGTKPPDAVTSPDTPVKVITLCDVWTQAIGLLDPDDTLRPILAAVRDQDYRALAVSAVSAIFSPSTTEEMCCGSEDATCTDTVALYGRLAKSVVSYVLMPRNDQDASLAARAAFKSAAVDVIRATGSRDGVEHSNDWRTFLIPSGTLRASWSASYQDEDSRHTGLRVMPTVDMLSIRQRISYGESPVYIGGVISLIDLLAPVTELVSRDANLKYANKGLVLAELIQPRIAAIFAVPDLSKHTVLTLGASMRGAAPFDLHEKVDGAERYGYSTIIRAPSVKPYEDPGDVFGQLFEVSAGVQYVP